jgi:hypothetical protein
MSDSDDDIEALRKAALASLGSKERRDGAKTAISHGEDKLVVSPEAEGRLKPGDEVKDYLKNVPQNALLGQTANKQSSKTGQDHMPKAIQNIEMPSLLQNNMSTSPSNYSNQAAGVSLSPSRIRQNGPKPISPHTPSPCQPTPPGISPLHPPRLHAVNLVSGPPIPMPQFTIPSPLVQLPISPQFAGLMNFRFIRPLGPSIRYPFVTLAPQHGLVRLPESFSSLDHDRSLHHDRFVGSPLVFPPRPNDSSPVIPFRVSPAVGPRFLIPVMSPQNFPVTSSPSAPQPRSHAPVGQG